MNIYPINAHLEYCPETEEWIASIAEGGKYKGCVVTSNTVYGALRELSISMEVLDDYNKHNL